MTKIKHILFDCDGVLVDTEYVAAHKMCEALNQHGASVDIDHYHKVHSGTTFSAILEHYFGNSMSSEAKSDLMNHVEAQVAKSVKAVNGISQLLNSLAINKSVVSNSSIATVEHALKTTGMSEYFDNRIFSSEQVKRAKPAPDLYLFALNSLNLSREEILVVEDSRTGAQAAVAAGLKVVGFTGASHILPGHSDKLLEIGVIDVAEDALSLEKILVSMLEKEIVKR